MENATEVLFTRDGCGHTFGRHGERGTLPAAHSRPGQRESDEAFLPSNAPDAYLMALSIAAGFVLLLLALLLLP